MSELTFVDELPVKQHGGGRGPASKTFERAAEIKAHPGRWAQWPASRTLTHLRHALEKVEPGFEVAIRKVDGKSVPFVRYVEPNGASDRPPPEPASTRPRALCPNCTRYVDIETGEDSRRALQRHGQTNPVCRAVLARRR